MGDPGQDYDFIKASLNIVNAEIEWSNIAHAKTTNDDVKTLSRQTTSEATSVAERLTAEAKARKIKLPDGLTGKYKKEVEKLNALTGDAFDKEYVSALIKLQHEDVGKMRDEAKASKDPSLVDFASKTADQVTSRNDFAKSIDKKLNGK